MKKTLIIICLIIVLTSVVFSGCTQEESSVNTAPSNTKSSSGSIDINQIPEYETIETILSKPESIDSMYYEISMNMEIDMEMEMSGFGEQTALIKIWQKDPYLKAEITTETGDISTSILVIQSPEGIYLYDAEKDEYILSTDDVYSLTSSLQYFDNDMILEYISNISSSDFESDLIDGKEATIIEYSPTAEDSSIYVKLWIWNEKGVPLKGIINLSFEEMVINMEFMYSNYSFYEIPDSTFNV
jgi:outer membrane lipoprotein-sorting protein